MKPEVIPAAEPPLSAAVQTMQSRPGAFPVAGIRALERERGLGGGGDHHKSGRGIEEVPSAGGGGAGGAPITATTVKEEPVYAEAVTTPVDVGERQRPLCCLGVAVAVIVLALAIAIPLVLLRDEGPSSIPPPAPPPMPPRSDRRSSPPSAGPSVGPSSIPSGPPTAPPTQEPTSDTCDATHKVVADDGEDNDRYNNDRFGGSSDIDGDYLIVGDPYDNIDQWLDGSAYILHRDDDGGWSQQTKLVASQPSYADRFGDSVAISSDVALVGSGGTAGSGNKVEVFVLQDGTTNDWSWEATLEGSDYTFGHSLDIDGNTAIVGEYYYGKGKAYLYVRDDETREWLWSEPQVIEASDGVEGDRFGISVAIRGDTAIVGASGVDNYKGSAYVLVRNEADKTWKEDAKLTASDGTDGDWFYYIRVAIQDNVAIVGAWYTPNGGTVYAFVRGLFGWEERSSVTGQEFGAASRFGFSVALDGDRVVIGATEDLAGKGKAYLVDVDAEGELTMDRELVAHGLAAQGQFGYSVGISGGTIVVGAPLDDDGSTYIFENCVTDGEGGEGGDGSDNGDNGRYVRRG